MDEKIKQTIALQMSELPDSLIDFIFDTDWAKKLKSHLESYDLEEYQKTVIENDLFFVLICIQNKDQLVSRIVSRADLDENTARKIVDFINGAILGPISNEIKKVWEEYEKIIDKKLDQEEQEGAQSGRQSKVGDSFAENILNQARGMMPAIDPNDQNNVPSNLPVQEQTPENSKVIHNYTSKTDPYREPVE